MLLHFSKHCCLSIQSSSMWINFSSCLLFGLLLFLKFFLSPRLLPLPILPILPPRPPLPEMFIFLFYPINSDIYWAKLYFLLLVFVFFAVLISSFLSCWVRKLLCLIFCLCWTINHKLSLVTLSCQPPLNPISRSYVVYGLTISTTHHYSGHNRSNLTVNRLDMILPSKQKTTIDLDLHQACIVPDFLIL